MLNEKTTIFNDFYECTDCEKLAVKLNEKTFKFQKGTLHFDTMPYSTNNDN